MKNIFGYYFAVKYRKANGGYIATAPGVGGIFEEGATKDEAISNAYTTACTVLESRIEHNAPITEDNPHLVVLRDVPSLKNIASIKTIPDGYISTPQCQTPATV